MALDFKRQDTKSPLNVLWYKCFLCDSDRGRGRNHESSRAAPTKTCACGSERRRSALIGAQSKEILVPFSGRKPQVLKLTFPPPRPGLPPVQGEGICFSLVLGRASLSPLLERLEPQLCALVLPLLPGKPSSTPMPLKRARRHRSRTLAIRRATTSPWSQAFRHRTKAFGLPLSANDIFDDRFLLIACPAQ